MRACVYNLHILSIFMMLSILANGLPRNVNAAVKNHKGTIVVQLERHVDQKGDVSVRPAGGTF